MSDDEFDSVRARALEAVFEELPRAAHPGRAAVRSRREVHREVVVRRVATAVVAAAVLVGVVAVLQVTQRQPPAGGSRVLPSPVSTPAPSITVDGHALRYAGVVPWRDAVQATEDSREVTLAGDGDAVHGADPICGGTDAQRVQVLETATSIQIRVLGYATPDKFAISDCAGVGHAATEHTVQLKAPVGERPLIDLSNQSRHAVLTDSDVPKASRVPAGFVDRGATWDDRFQSVSRSYVLRGGAGSGAEHFDLEIGIDSTFSPLDHPYWAAGPATVVAGQTAAVWRHSDIYNANTLIEWRDGSLTYRLTTFGTPAHHLTEQQAVDAAQSVSLDRQPLPAVTR
ncbi:hypothetical protein [Amnibacterium kyonggiense]|uniref:Uncharacterized protein n=1 Tax=Amnibacterium kyonggiense TaxID=595671 RepID=A0A4R7FRA3_9MICO|nr:hypothetical protein [Amnibacterium kyonggiense]TDS80331.1 hypothetical protein CLV52_0888 [Amnibacterium kyonggiense]